MTATPKVAVTVGPPADHEWDELDRSARVTQVFQSRAWVQAWLGHLGHDAMPSLVSVRQGGALRGLAPMIVERDPACGQPERVRFAGTDLNDYNDLLGGQAEAASIIEHLLATFDVPVVLENVPPSGVLAEAASSSASSWDRVIGPPVPCPTTGMLDQAPEMPSKRVREWSRIVDRLSAVGELTIDLLQDPLVVAAFAPSFVECRLDAWKVRRKYETLLAVQRDPAFPAFLGEVLRELADRGRAFFMNLWHDGRLLASDLWFRHGAEALVYMRFFDPGAARAQPGLVLMWQTVPLLWRDGVRRVHFGRGDEPYKRLFGAGSEVVLNLACRRASHDGELPR